MKKAAPLLFLLLPLAAACGTKDHTPRASGIPTTSTTATTLAPLEFETTTTAPGDTASGDEDVTTTTNPDSPTSTASVGG